MKLKGCLSDSANGTYGPADIDNNFNQTQIGPLKKKYYVKVKKESEDFEFDADRMKIASFIIELIEVGCIPGSIISGILAKPP